MPSRPIQKKKNTYIITSSVWKENRNTAQNSYQSVYLGRKKLKEGDWKYVEKVLYVIFQHFSYTLNILNESSKKIITSAPLRLTFQGLFAGIL